MYLNEEGTSLPGKEALYDFVGSPAERCGGYIYHHSRLNASGEAQEAFCLIDVGCGLEHVPVVDLLDLEVARR